ncbi:MAG: ribosome biogenesis GTPase Der [Gammaproteobacteria bacterium GWE2_42_36]|nr:MAG: ribosome biogenesis GTPase Der [Gammaproteobacteria bacterium GWE2_42_36]
MIPVVTIVGRPNVGKSTLFNCLTKSRQALVGDRPGLTRDRQYGHCEQDGRPFILVDTGGLTDSKEEINLMAAQQVKVALKEANLLLFLVDAREGLTPQDEEIARELRLYSKPILFVLNKIDGIDVEVHTTDFFKLGFGEPVQIAAAHRRGITNLQEAIAKHFPVEPIEEQQDEVDAGIKLAIVGRPNVGKSTLVNRILGEERVMVFDEPGTTRDSIYIPFERRHRQYTLIDTAGIRRRSRITDLVEKFSIVKTLQAIEECHVVLFMIDAKENIADQDLKILGHILESGKSLVIAINKWDGLEDEAKSYVKKELERRLVFIEYAKWHVISALHGTGVGNLFESINKAYFSATRDLSTPELTRLLERAVKEHQPPLVKGRRIKLRYAHPGGHKPPLIVIHGNQLESLPGSYKRYLENFFREKLNIVGTPIRFEFKTSKNPYAK